MNRLLAALAFAALLPAMIDGALQHPPGAQITMALCAGGSISIAAGGPDQPRPANAPCCSKGCRNGERKRRGGIDPAQ